MTPEERDASVDRLLRSAMAAEVRSAPGECLDADALAAWSDGALSAAEQAVAEAHASRCARCQAMLAAMVRTAPPVEVPARSPFFRWVITLGPAVAAAAAVVLWFAVDRRSAPPALPERPAVIATVPESRSTATQAAPAAPAETDAFRAKEKTDTDKKVQADERRFADAAPSSRVGVVSGDLQNRNERAGVAGAAAKEASKPADRERELRAAESPAPPLPVPAVPPPPPAGPVAVGAAPNAAPVAPQQSVDRIQAEQRQNVSSSSQPAGQTQTGAVVSEQKARDQAGERKAFLGRADGSTLDVPSPIPTFRWRVVDGRNVQLSTNDGRIWTTQYTVDTPTLILAGAAPTPSVCWLVGQGGLVLVTKDGRTWQRIKFPELVDLRSVTASDANTASVVTADGRTFTTTTAGTTWTQR